MKILADAADAGAVGFQEETYYDCDEAQHDERCEDVGDTFQAGIPSVVSPTDRLHHAPHTVSQVEPECDEPNDVRQREVPLSKGVSD